MAGYDDYEQRHLDRDGFRLGVHRYPSDTDRAAVVLPAMGVPAGYYRRFALHLRDNGFDVSVADLRGTGSSTPRAARRVDFGYADLLTDITAVYEHLAADVDGRRVLLLGHSLGGQLGLLHRAHHPVGLDVRAMGIVASGLPYHALYGRRSPMVLGTALGMRLTSAAVGHWPGYGIAGRQPRRLIRDWAHTVHTGRFPAIDGNDSDAALASVELPVLAVTIEGDRLTPEYSNRHLTDKLTGAKVETQRYGHADAGARIGHLTWVRHAGALTPRLVDFFERVLSPGGHRASTPWARALANTIALSHAVRPGSSASMRSANRGSSS